MPGQTLLDAPGKGSSISVQLRHICLEYPYAQLEAATANFNDSHRLGSGFAGTVYRAEMPDGSDAAVKVIDLEALGDDSMLAGFEEEIAVLSKFRHPNLVVLMGWARQGTKRFLIYEYLSGGDAHQRLQKCKEQNGSPFLWHERLSVARGAATGLAHLHNASPEAFHRDVKTSNILLGGNGAKMADFGLSCVAKTRKDKDFLCEFPSGTPGYTCPTYIRTGKVTEASEMYSFGTVLLELLVNLVPAGMLGGNLVYPIQEAVQPDMPGAVQRCAGLVDPYACWPSAVVHEVASLALACIDHNCDRRPNFNDTCRKLRSIQERFPASEQESLGALKPLQAPGAGYHCQQGTGALYEQNVPEQRPQRENLSQRRESSQRAGDRSKPRYEGAKDVSPSPPPKAKPHRPVSPRYLGAPLSAQANYACSPSPAKPVPAGAAVQGWKNMQSADAAAGIVASTPPACSPSCITLEVVYLHGVPVDALPRHERVLVLPGTVGSDGRHSVQIGRHCQAQWFEALLMDPAHRNSVSRVACEISWGGPESKRAGPYVRTLGSNLLLVDDFVVAKDVAAKLHPSSKIRFMFQQGGNELGVILALAVRCGSSASGPAGQLGVQAKVTVESLPADVICEHAVNEQGLRRALQQGPKQVTVPTEAETGILGQNVPPNVGTAPLHRFPPPSRVNAPNDHWNWRLDCVYAIGFSPEAFASVPASARTFNFVMSAGCQGINIGRQHQKVMYETLLAHHKDLLGFVSRTHLLVEPGASMELKVTNLSQNAVLLGTAMLQHGEAARVGSGDTLSFAAQVELIHGGDLAALPARCQSSDQVAIAPFLSFRLIGSVLKAAPV